MLGAPSDMGSEGILAPNKSSSLDGSILGPERAVHGRGTRSWGAMRSWMAWALWPPQRMCGTGATRMGTREYRGPSRTGSPLGADSLGVGRHLAEGHALRLRLTPCHSQPVPAEHNGQTCYVRRRATLPPCTEQKSDPATAHRLQSFRQRFGSETSLPDPSTQRDRPPLS